MPGTSTPEPPTATTARPGRHSSLHTGETPAVARPARHRRVSALPAGTLARVEAAGRAATRQAAVPAPAAAPVPETVPATAPVPSGTAQAAGTPDDEAVTDLVSRAGSKLSDGAGTGPVPGRLGLAGATAALVAAGVDAAIPAGALPAGGSQLVLVVLLVLALLATGCAALGATRRRTGRPLAVTGVIVGLAAAVACVVPLALFGL